MGPNKHDNTGARFERLIDSLFWGDDSPDLETEDNEYAEYSEDNTSEEEPEEDE
jgi:hypothetical protein